MGCKRIIRLSIIAVFVIVSSLTQAILSGSSASSVAENITQVVAGGQDTVVEPRMLKREDPGTIDVKDIVVKEHHWVEVAYAGNIHWTSDGKYVIFGGGIYGLYAVDVLCQNLRSLGRMYYYGVLPDGKTVYGKRTKLETVTIRPEQMSEKEYIRYRISRNPAFLERKVLKVEGIFAVDVEDGSVRQITDDQFNLCILSSDGKYIAARNKSFEWSLLSSDGTNLDALNPPTRSQPVWSSYGNRLLYAAIDENVYVIDMDGGNTTISKGDNCGWVGGTDKVWIHDSRTNDITTMNPDGTGVEVIANCSPQEMPMFSPSGINWVIHNEVGESNSIVWWVTNGEEVKLEIPDYLYYHDIRWLPEEDRFLIHDVRWHWYMISLNTPEGTKSERLLGTAESPWNADLLHGSRLIAFSKNNLPNLGISDADGENVILLTQADSVRSYGMACRGIAWSPLGNAIAYTGWDGSKFRIGVIILGRKGM